MKQGFAKFSLQCPIKRAAEAPQVAQWSRICLPTQDMQEMQFLGWEDPLEKEIATPRTEKTGRLHPWGHKESDMIQHKRKIDFFFFFRKVQIRRAFRNPNGPPFTVRSTFQQENVWHRQSHLEQAYEDSDLQLLKGDSVLSLCTPR